MVLDLPGHTHNTHAHDFEQTRNQSSETTQFKKSQTRNQVNNARNTIRTNTASDAKRYYGRPLQCLGATDKPWKRLLELCQRRWHHPTGSHYQRISFFSFGGMGPYQYGHGTYRCNQRASIGNQIQGPGWVTGVDTARVGHHRKRLGHGGVGF